MEQVRELLAQGLQEMGLTPPEGAVDKLCRYGQLLLERNQVMNLTAITEPVAVARLHFLDSAAVLAYGGGAPSVLTQSKESGAEGSDPVGGLAASTWLAGKTLIDVGTGAGFPGVVLKILEPSLTLTLADSLGKRVRWLGEVCEVLSLDGVRCLHARAEELALEPGFRDGFDLAASRAVASFPLLCELCLPFVRPGGAFLSMKSVESEEEVSAGANAVKRLGGRLSGHVDYDLPGAGVTHRLVRVDKLSPTPKGLPRSWGKIKKSPL